MTQPRYSRATGACICALASLFLANVHVAQAQDEDYVPGVWHFRSVACVVTTVKLVEPRLVGGDQTKFTAQDFESGVNVVFNTTLGSDPAHPKMLASVTHYQDTVGNNIMMKEHAGDKVQVCFISRPAPAAGCNPDEDGRGRVFRVYDYRQHAQYAGQNGEHGCGGA